MKGNRTHRREVMAGNGEKAMDRRDFLKVVGTTAIAASVGGLDLLKPDRAWAQAKQRPLSDFINAQGTLFPNPFPPFVAPAFIGWFAPPIPLPRPPVYVIAGNIDYAGLVNKWLVETKGLPSLGTTVFGSVTERLLSDGSVEVTVLLQTKNAFANAIAVLPGFTLGPVLFGFTDYEIDANPSLGPLAVGESFLQAVFKNTAFGAPLPDLATFPPSLMTLSFRGTATGRLRAAFGVPEGTPGRMTISQTGLIATAGKANPNSRVALDAFPAELVNLQVVGR